MRKRAQAGVRASGIGLTAHTFPVQYFRAVMRGQLSDSSFREGVP
jgi:hypothetical protein